jgi:hypothetical protein
MHAPKKRQKDAILGERCHKKQNFQNYFGGPAAQI